MRKLIFSACFGLAALTSFAQNLSKAELDGSYFHVEEKHLLTTTEFPLVEMKLTASGRDIDPSSFPEIDHWALLISKHPDYQIEVLVHGSTLDRPELAMSKTEDVAEKIRLRFLKMGLSSAQFKMHPMGSEDPLNTQRSIDSIYNPAWKPLAHEMNARVTIVVRRIMP